MDAVLAGIDLGWPVFRSSALTPLKVCSDSKGRRIRRGEWMIITLLEKSKAGRGRGGRGDNE